MSTPLVRVWQIYFKPQQIAHLDPFFVPLDNTAYRDESLEFGVFSRLHASRLTSQFSHWGAVSWKFTQKTGLESQSLLQAVHEAPDVDVFYMNPYPYNEALHVSPWWQGETAHPEPPRESRRLVGLNDHAAKRDWLADNWWKFASASAGGI